MGKIIAFANQKGGVGKTTTAHNLEFSLPEMQKKRVLLLDLDAQGNLSDACGLDPQTLEYTVFDVLAGNASIAEAKSTLEAGLDILPANIRLAEAELAFAGRIGRENLLKKALLSVSGEYDYALIDCPPSLGLLTVNALNAANGLLILYRSSITLWRGWRSSGRLLNLSAISILLWRSSGSS